MSGSGLESVARPRVSKPMVAAFKETGAKKDYKKLRFYEGNVKAKAQPPVKPKPMAKSASVARSSAPARVASKSAQPSRNATVVSENREQMLKEVSRSWQRPKVFEIVKKDKSNVPSSRPASWDKSTSDDFAPSHSSLAQKRSISVNSESYNRESYDSLKDNDFKDPRHQALSTFSVDVDTASYSNVRRILSRGQLPPAGAVRIEELINYFPYQLEAPARDEAHPFRVTTELATSPWNKKNKLMKVSIKGYEVSREQQPDTNLVFLIDVSGSMRGAKKLGLVKQSLELLINKMRDQDRVAFVVYAGASGLVLPSTTANNKATLLHALTQLKSGGSTNGGAGIELAYDVAQKNFIKGGNNRVILCSDGDFNVGVSDRSSLVKLIEAKAKQGVFLTILGFGQGNYQDAQMEELSNKGNGNYAYIDDLKEAKKVLVEQAGGTLLTIAKDVKVQVEFNPSQVAAYRLIGYANRVMAAEDFNNDKKDAGEIGAGHSVTALYEIVPAGIKVAATSVDALKYQKKVESEEADYAGELCTVKFRYKQPDGDKSTLISVPVDIEAKNFASATVDFRFASAVAGFGMLLRDSEYKGELTYAQLIELIEESKGLDSGGYRKEFQGLVEQAARLSTQNSKQE